MDKMEMIVTETTFSNVLTVERIRGKKKKRTSFTSYEKQGYEADIVERKYAKSIEYYYLYI